jgi:hypothetical protein
MGRPVARAPFLTGEIGEHDRPTPVSHLHRRTSLARTGGRAEAGDEGSTLIYDPSGRADCERRAEAGDVEE